MQRYFIVILIVLWFPPFSVSAQTLYNSSGNGSSSALYNSPGLYSDNRGGPLSLKQLLQGNQNATLGAKDSSYYGRGNFRPYGIDNNNYSLSLTPQQIRESRARRDAIAQQRERESLASIERAEFIPIEGESNQGLNSFQRGTGATATGRRQIKSKYKQRDNNFEMPKKVFNSIY